MSCDDHILTKIQQNSEIEAKVRMECPIRSNLINGVCQSALREELWTKTSRENEAYIHDNEIYVKISTNIKILEKICNGTFARQYSTADGEYTFLPVYVHGPQFTNFHSTVVLNIVLCRWGRSLNNQHVVHSYLLCRLFPSSFMRWNAWDLN